MNGIIKFFSICALLLGVCVSAQALQSVSLTWDYSNDPDVAGYFMYLGTSSGNYSARIDVGTNTVATISGLQEGVTYYFVVTAYNHARVESLPSNEASFTVPTAPSANYPTSPNGPLMTAVSPTSGQSGSQVSVYGLRLTGTSAVKFNGAPATFTVVSDTLLTALVPPGASSGQLTVTTANGICGTAFSILPSVIPANDDFANAQVLTGLAAQVYASNRGASGQAGEPDHAGNGGGSSIWYRWTAPATGNFTIDTTGTDFNLLLAVYTGSLLNSLSPVTNNRTANGGLTNVISFKTTAGVTYQIAIDGQDGATGDAVLRLFPPPAASWVIYSNTFESSGGFLVNSVLSGTGGWLSTGQGGNGILNGLFSGNGQQAYIGLLSLASGNNLTVYRPLNYTVNTNLAPVVQFSVMMEVSNLFNLCKDAFAWTVRNNAGHEFFNLSFDNQTKLISYSLDNGGALVSTGHSFDNVTAYNLLVTMDFGRNLWSASLNGTDLVGQKAITTSGAALSVGDIAAKANFKDVLRAGMDGMVFDNYIVTALPVSLPSILLSPQSQTVNAGDSIVLGVAAAGNPTLRYQWYFKNALLSGATNATLLLNNVTSTQAGNYYAVVSNAGGSATSASAAISVTAPALPRPVLSTPTLAGGNGVKLNLTVPANNTYRLQASTDMSAWTTLGTYYAYGSNLTFFDPAATNFPRRFYRVVSP